MDETVFTKIASPTTDQISEVVEGLHSFGLRQIGGEEPVRVAVLCEHPRRKTVGGAVGHSLRHRFYLTQLWVAEHLRSKGIGTELVAQMEAIARESQCRDIVVDTLSERAVSFYEGLGFEPYSVNRDYIRGFHWHFLSKSLG